MIFATRQDLLTRSNALRLAQLAVPTDLAMVRLDVVRTALMGGSIADEPADVQAAVAEALTAIDHALTDAHELIVGYGVSTTATSATLTRMCCTVALYYLQGAERLDKTDGMAYDGVIKLLEQHKRGLVDLTPSTNTTGTPSADDSVDTVVMESAPGRFGASAFTTDDEAL